MAQWPHLARAPISEALLDIRAKLPLEIDLAALAAVQDPVRDRYPHRRERHVQIVGFQVKPGTQPEVMSAGGPDGYVFDSEDRREVFQARLDGFTFNRMTPYESWQQLRDEARDLWDHYAAIARPLHVTRIALRYLNRFLLPFGVSYRNYLLTYPEVAAELPQGLAQFFVRIVIPPDALSGNTAIVTETTEPAAGDRLPLILDIDVYREVSMKPDDPALWECFEELREVKNRIFFQSITPEARALCQ